MQQGGRDRLGPIAVIGLPRLPQRGLLCASAGAQHPTSARRHAPDVRGRSQINAYSAPQTPAAQAALCFSIRLHVPPVTTPGGEHLHLQQGGGDRLELIVLPYSNSMGRMQAIPGRRPIVDTSCTRQHQEEAGQSHPPLVLCKNT
ncbi:hypothetical protein NDU88_000955, partial [Pleurodeles waltl]